MKFSEAGRNKAGEGALLNKCRILDVLLLILIFRTWGSMETNLRGQMEEVDRKIFRSDLTERWLILVGDYGSPKRWFTILFTTGPITLRSWWTAMIQTGIKGTGI
ncbi:hypothetical protein ACS0TY_014248 [Phlomoides rotata]